MDDGHHLHGNVEEMRFERRMVSLLILLAFLGAPALGLRLLCAGHSCDEPVRSTATIPFCSLESGLRDLIASGFREGRSPDVLAVTRRPIRGGTYFGKMKPSPEWPSEAAVRSTRVPVALRAPGLGLPGGRSMPPGTGLDDIAPTLAGLMGLERPHPEVRSGRGIPDISEGAGNVRLVLQIVWKGVGSEDLERDPDAWPTARALIDRFGTMDAGTESLPTDPTAVLTTIGTGGLPAQHGITGSIVRDDGGTLREAWSREAPVYVIAGLADDLDDHTGQRARVGMVASRPTDRGLIGHNWYVDGDRDDFVTVRRSEEVEAAVDRLLRDGYGRDDTPDLLAVALEQPLSRMDDTTDGIIESALGAVGTEALAVAFTTTGSTAPEGALPSGAVARGVERELPAQGDVVAATVSGGLYLNQDVLAQETVSDDEIIDAMKRVTDGSGSPVFDDVFPAIAVSFGKYC